MAILESFDINVAEEIFSLEQARKVKGIISADFLPKFEHINAETIDEAVFLLKTYGGRAAIIAGGTDLLSELKNRVRPTQPKVLINIKSISPRLDYIEEDNTCLTIGSLANLHSIETNWLIQRKYSILAQAAHATRALQYRNMATTGGELCQRVKCWYYRASGNAFFCYRKGGDKCYALDGDNRYHSTFGGEVCFATCPSDTAPALVALDAKVKIVGVLGERIIPLEEFFTPLGNTLGTDEMITEVQIPIPEPDSRGIFLKFGLGNIFGRTIASVAVMVRVDKEVCRSARIVLGGVSPVPWRTIRAERILVGKRITSDIAESAARVAIEGATPLSMNAYKVDIVKTLLKRAVLGIAYQG